MPAVSVIIPTYNRGDMIIPAVDSVLRQTFTDFEIVIIDDGSEDATEGIIKGLANGKIIFRKLEKRVGAACARNMGIKLSSGEYVAFLDSDDEWLPGKLESQVGLLRKSNEGVGVVYSGLCYVDDKGRERGFRIPYASGDIKLEILKKNCVGPLSSVIVRRKCFKTSGVFDESLPSCQDWDLYIRLAKEFDFAYIATPLVKYHFHDSKITKNYYAKAIGHEMVLKKHLGEIKKNRRAHSEQRFVIAHYLILCGKSFRGILEFIKAIGLWPLRLKYYLHLGCSLLGRNAYSEIAKIIKKRSLSKE